MRGSMHELSKQFLRPSSPSGSQKSSRYKQMEDVGFIFVWIAKRMFSKEFNVHKTQCAPVYHSTYLTTHTHSFFSGQRTPPDPRSPINPIPQPADPRTGEPRTEPGPSQAPTRGTPHEAPRSTETEVALKTPTTSSPESPTRSSSRYPRTATRPPGCPGPASTAPT